MTNLLCFSLPFLQYDGQRTLSGFKPSILWLCDMCLNTLIIGTITKVEMEEGKEERVMGMQGTTVNPL